MSYKHEEVAAELVAAIASPSDATAATAWPPGARLPSEAELADDYRVSVPTVRRALATLAQSGIVQRKQGRGTFVTEDGPRRALEFVSPLEQLFAEAAGNASETAIDVGGRAIYHPQGPLAAIERFEGNAAVRAREAAHYELLGRTMEVLSFGGNENVHAWVVTAESRVNIEWSFGVPTLDVAIARVMPRLPHNEGGIPGLRMRTKTSSRADLFWIHRDPPIHLSLRHHA